MTTQTFRYMALAAALLGGVAANAQYNQSIDVDGTYVPEVIPAERLGFYPRAARFGVETSPLQYSLTGVPASFAPQAQPLPASGWRDTRRFSSKRGYLDLGLGSWLNATLSAGYRFVNTESTEAGVFLQHTGTSLWKPKLSEPTADRKQWRYDETLGVFASHLFEDAGRLGGEITYHIGNFNYYGWLPADESVKPGDPSQTLNDASLRLRWESATTRHISWSAHAGARYFGYRSLYLYTPQGNSPEHIDGGRETHANIGGDFRYMFNDNSRLDIALEGDLLAYASIADEPKSFMSAPSTYGAVTLTPGYRYGSASGFSFRAGAKLDFIMNARNYAGKRYDTFRAAPDVRLDYSRGAFMIFAHATGGTRLHTLAGEYEADYYSMPALLATDPVYTPVDARLGIGFGPFGGFTVGLEGAYAVNLGQYAGGLYSAWLNENAALPGRTYDLRGFQALLRLGYDAGRYFRIDAEGVINAGKGEHGYFDGYDRPRQRVAVNVESNPWSRLRLGLRYDFRGQRYLPFYSADGAELLTERLHNLSLLGFNVSYGITETFTVWGRADNILNRHDARYPALPQQGIALSAGISWVF